MRNFKYYSDPGHGWIAVKLDLVADLGILDKISGFSYLKGGTVYLEEDRDAQVFSVAYREKHGAYTLEEIHTSDRSSIRRYGNYSADSAKEILDRKKTRRIVE